MTRIDSSFYLQNQQQMGGTESNTLGKDAFLKILMAQIQNQSPLDPMKDKEFIAQMTQFSSLEQMTNMSQAMQGFMTSQSLPPVVKYSGMIGKEVTYPVHDGTGAATELATGVVKAVSQKEGETKLELQNGESVYVYDITKVSETTTEE
ncbi:flagellar hook assembly protein FlgD [Halobacillus shinanisalinarum]|uniref:Flagellar hook assembly protein FlgD n=1 Tax=Halobacillus shinanisalinarum TaxID=2932258 RepID=A0ABY4GYH9_9BACI|nr:flagellar hook assembly protein FlgD [Halobacillus shinanisalinarum]UOQ93223.1 flagellar hook assembly protein FlgD [Halobacillus shinanisalinarum]